MKIRMKNNRLLPTPPRLLVLSLVLMGLAACLRLNPANPTPFPTTSYDLTSVAETMLPMPSATDTPGVTPNPDQTATLPALNPQKFIYFYFDNINARNYSLTWSLLTARFQAKSGGYQAYLNFWNSVRLATVGGAFYTCQGDLCAVDVILKLEYTNGKVTNEVISYSLMRDHTRNIWMFDSIPLPTHTPSRTPTRTLTRTVTRTGTSTSTPTRTTTRTATGSGTPTASPSPSATPTLTRTLTLTPSASPSGTGTPTPSGTATLTPTPSFTPTPSSTPTASGTPTPSETPTASETPTETATSTP